MTVPIKGQPIDVPGMREPDHSVRRAASCVASKRWTCAFAKRTVLRRCSIRPGASAAIARFTYDGSAS